MDKAQRPDRIANSRSFRWLKIPLQVPIIFYGLFAGYIVFATYHAAHAKYRTELQDLGGKPSSSSDKTSTWIDIEEYKIATTEEKLALQQDYLEKRSAEVDKNFYY